MIELKLSFITCVYNPAVAESSLDSIEKYQILLQFQVS